MSFWSPCKQRLRRLMGTELVSLTNERYMNKLAQRVKEEYEEDQARREEELALEEIRREKELVLKGILETPYQPRRRHPLTKQVLGVGRPRESHTKRKSSRKLKKESTSRTEATRSKHATGAVGKTGQVSATQCYNGKLFTKSTFGDVFQRLTSSLTSPVTSRLANTKDCDSDEATNEMNHCQKKDDTTDKQKHPSKLRRRRKKKRRRSKTQRRLFRIRSIHPNIGQDAAADQSSGGLEKEEERTLVSQLEKTSLI